MTDANAHAHPVIACLSARFGDGLIETHTHRGDATAVVRPDRYHEVIAFLREDTDCAFDFLTDLCGVDRLELKLKPRFEVIVYLYSSRTNSRFRLKTRPLNDADPVIDSIVDLFPAANWPEREVYDMFGVRFTGHPNLTRILMYEEFVGYPLRKDYPVNKRQPRVPMREIPDDRPGMIFL
ncbi:MAG TPA: NADH-quinone oxidoreductase subunit C [candidate division Zixibacteria bacterium]|jgi:NADH-quinone oxidoreductase subunit C